MDMAAADPKSPAPRSAAEFHRRRASGSRSARRRPSGDRPVWIFGIHAVRAALLNPARQKHRLILTKNAAGRLAAEIGQNQLDIEYADPRKFPAPLAAESVHQGAALEAEPLLWPDLKALCEQSDETARMVILDRVSDPHNVGAVLRSAQAFGADAVIAPARHAPPETGSLAKSASGALESVPYLRVSNLAAAMKTLRGASFTLVGFDSASPAAVSELQREVLHGRIGLALGSESSGLRDLTRKNCDWVVQLCPGSLNVSNAAAVALFAAQRIN